MKDFVELRRIMNRCSLDDLKKGLGADVLDLAEYLNEDPTKNELIETAIGGFGSNLLQKQSLRFVLLLNHLTPKQIQTLSASLKCEADEPTEMLLQLSKIAPASRSKFIKILAALGLDDSYLSVQVTSIEESSIYIEKQPGDFLYEQLDYQFDVRRKVIKFFRELPAARALMHMPTGAGKTRTAMHIIQELWSIDYNQNGYILWLAHSEELLRQALSTFENTWHYLGQFSTNTIKLWGKFDWQEQKNPNGIIFGGIQKLQSIIERKPEVAKAILRHLNLVVIDECHKAPAKKTHQLVLNFINKQNNQDRLPNLLGLTATPGRKGNYDIEDKKLKLLFDSIKIGIDVDLMNEYSPGSTRANSEIELLQHRKILSHFDRDPIQISAEDLGLSPQEIASIKSSIESDGSKEIRKETMNKIANNKKRNNLIIERLRRLNDERIKTIFFACNVAHAKLINAALHLLNIKAGLILGETDPRQREQVIVDFKSSQSPVNILINVGVLTTGFDSPNIDCVFISRPVTSVILYSQMIGRGIRGPMMGGKEVCKLIDVIDNLDFGDEKWAFNYFDNYWN